MVEKSINVLVADDSKVARMLLIHLLESDPQIHVMGAVSDGQEAMEFLADNKPDVVLMDIHMPRMDGIEATRRIMETQPVPIIICSATTDPRELATTFQLMQAGAVACLEKPVSHERPEYAQLVAHLLKTVKLMSEVKVVRRWSKSRMTASAAPVAIKPTSIGARLVGIGASTGGPPVLQTILSNLPGDFPLPILVVQHIACGFLPGLVEWLNQTTQLKVQIATHGTSPSPGNVYMAPDDVHMRINGNGCIQLCDDPPSNGLRPSVAALFQSLADVCGARAIGVLLTGMGKDGAVELKRIKDRGAVTIAQNRETSVVYGMPGEAARLEAATYIFPGDQIAPALIALASHRSLSGGKSHECCKVNE
jgi:two-component system, chemotaxis family, protein-glutamate methylesterase/glutaminase